MTPVSDEEAAAAADAHTDEWERWFYRRKNDKSGYEVVRMIGDPNLIVDDNMVVTDLDPSVDIAKAKFWQIRRIAAGRAALEAVDQLRAKTKR